MPQLRKLEGKKDFLNLLKDEPQYWKKDDVTNQKVSIELDNLEFSDDIIFNQQDKFVECPIRLRDCCFHGKFEFESVEIKNEFWFSNSEFRDIVAFRGGKYNSIKISGGIFHEEFFITGGTFEKVNILQGVFKKSIIIDNRNYQTEIEDLNLERKIDYDIQITSVNKLLPLLIIRTLTIKNHLTSNAWIYLFDIVISNLKFVNLSNSGHIDICGVSIKEGLQNYLFVSNSTLGAVEFIDLNFLAFKTICIENSNFSKISTRIKHFPENFEKICTICDLKNKTENEPCIICKDSGKKRDYIKIRELYVDLEKAAQKDGNRIQEMIYHSIQMNCHYITSIHKLSFKKLTIFTNFNEFRNNVNIYRKNLGDWFILFLLKYSNNFSQSWSLSFSFMLITGLIFFICKEMVLNYYVGIDLHNSGKMINEFILFLNPTRKFETETSLPTWSLIFDLLGRIFIAFGIYQLIASVWRYSSKGRSST